MRSAFPHSNQYLRPERRLDVAIQWPTDGRDKSYPTLERESCCVPSRAYPRLALQWLRQHDVRRKSDPAIIDIFSLGDIALGRVSSFNMGTMDVC
jgi:hypothetical protein